MSSDNDSGDDDHDYDVYAASVGSYDYNMGDWYDDDSDQDAQDSYHFKKYSHSGELLAELNRQRKAKEFLDVVVQVEDEEFPCHRAVLTSKAYFQNMLSSTEGTSKPCFTEGALSHIQLHGITPSSFSKLLDFLYTGEIDIEEDDVQDILQAADMLRFDEIVEPCRDFIINKIRPSNCVGVMHVADRYGFKELKKEAWEKAVYYFPEIERNEFVTLSTGELLDLLKDEKLKVTCEDDVVESVIRWLDHNVEDRKASMLTILQEIVLSRVRVSVLRKLEAHPVVQASVECRATITAVVERHHTGTWAASALVEADKSTCRDRHRMSDDLVIHVGGWKAVERHPDNEFPVQPEPLQSIICVEPDDKQWYRVTDLPTTVLGYMSVTSSQQHLYVTGGREQPLVGQGPHTAPSRQAWQYDFPTDTWVQLPDMLRGRAGHQSVVVEGKVYVVGGDADPLSDETTLFSMDCYDPEKGSWTNLPTVPAIDTSSNYKVTVCGGKVIVIQVPNIPAEHPFEDRLGSLGLSERGEPSERRSSQLCVHAFDATKDVWVYSDSPLRYCTNAVIRVNVVGDNLYIALPFAEPDGRTGGFVYHAKAETLSKIIEDDLKGKCLEAYLITIRSPKQYADGQEGIINTITNYDMHMLNVANIDFTWVDITLPFAIFGHSLLRINKRTVRWYCLDLAKLEIQED